VTRTHTSSRSWSAGPARAGEFVAARTFAATCTFAVTSTFAATIVLAATLGCPRDAEAHEFWLSPSRYEAAAGDTLMLSVLVGTGFRGEPRPWAGPRAVRFTWRDARVLDLRDSALNGDLAWARVPVRDGGGALCAFESNWADITLPAGEFDDYLALEGLSAPLAVRRAMGTAAGPGRERYARCPKTWIEGTRPERATHVEGLPLEIVALEDPSSASSLRVRVLDHGRPLAGALVRAWNRPLARGPVPMAPAQRDSIGPLAEVRTGPDGTATLDVSRSGEWLLACVHMVASEDRAEADWQSLWASYTFAKRVRP
jgi:Domain of unknown function (DUF4198)